MITKKQSNEMPKIPTEATLLYNPKPLANALLTLSQVEIENMLVNVSTLELQIAKLNIAGHEDEMMHLVTDGLRRLTYFLDAVKRHKDEHGDNK